VAAGVGIAGDAERVASLLAGFPWQLLPLILGLTSLNYLLRLVKWGFYLRLIGAPSIPPLESGLIFFSGLSMTITPGKLGEWIKSYLLRQRHGVPFGASAPIILAERLSDGLAMLLLASGGLIVYGIGFELLVLVGFGALAFVLFTQYRPAGRAVVMLLERLPLVRVRAHHLTAFLESANRLFSPLALTVAVGLGLVSWGGECLAFYFVLTGLGVRGGGELLLQSAFVLATSSLVGSISMLPGGLVVAEGSIGGMLLLLGITGQREVAAAATLLIRLCTLWFGTGIGVAALALLGRQAERASTPE
jgi:uncharacterized protein (TIRG00374 family)